MCTVNQTFQGTAFPLNWGKWVPMNINVVAGWFSLNTNLSKLLNNISKITTQRLMRPFGGQMKFLCFDKTNKIFCARNNILPFA